jgi:DNA-binding MarR family transcriptional regulator
MARQVERALGSGGPTLDQWRVLDLLADDDGQSMIEIATYALVPPPTLTKIVDRLIDSALVYRRPDETDRRRILVFLSERGREVHTTLAPRVARAEHEFVAELADTDVAHLVRLLGHLSG